MIPATLTYLQQCCLGSVDAHGDLHLTAGSTQRCWDTAWSLVDLRILEVERDADGKGATFRRVKAREGAVS
jgi:hypothetical protein